MKIQLNSGIFQLFNNRIWGILKHKQREMIYLVSTPQELNKGALIIDYLSE